MTAKNTTAPNPITRNSAGLRDALFDEIDSIRKGTSTPLRANAVAKLASSIVETVRMEMEVQRHVRSVPGGSVPTPVELPLGKPLALGSG